MPGISDGDWQGVMKSVDSTEAAFPTPPVAPAAAPAAPAQAAPAAPAPVSPTAMGPGESMDPDAATPAWMINPHTGQPYSTPAGIATARQRAMAAQAAGRTPTAQDVNPTGVALAGRHTNPQAYKALIAKKQQEQQGFREQRQQAVAQGGMQRPQVQRPSDTPFNELQSRRRKAVGEGLMAQPGPDTPAVYRFIPPAPSKARIRQNNAEWNKIIADTSTPGWSMKGKEAAADPTLEQLKIEFWSQPAEKVAAAIAVYPRLEKGAWELPDLSQLKQQAKKLWNDAQPDLSKLKEQAGELWANPQYEGIRNALVGAGVGGGLGLASATIQPEEHRDYGNRILTGAAIGGLGGLGYTYLPKALAGIQDAAGQEPHLDRAEAALKQKFDAQGATTPGGQPPLVLSPEARAKLLAIGNQLASNPDGPTGNAETFWHRTKEHPILTSGLAAPGAVGLGLGGYWAGSGDSRLSKILDRLSPYRLRNSLNELAENKDWSMVGEALGTGNLKPRDVLHHGIYRPGGAPDTAAAAGQGKKVKAPVKPPQLIPRETPPPYARGLTPVQPASRPGKIPAQGVGHTAENLREALLAHRAKNRKLPGRLGAVGATAGAFLGPLAEYYLGGGERRHAQEIRNRSGI